MQDTSGPFRNSLKRPSSSFWSVLIIKFNNSGRNTEDVQRGRKPVTRTLATDLFRPDYTEG